MLTVRVEPDLKKADYYVYVYIDPRDLKPFYYGMGMWVLVRRIYFGMQSRD
jgi:hypothetical protein